VRERARVEETMSEPAKATENKKARPKASHASEVTRPGFFAKLILMMLIDALGLYGMFTAYVVESWAVLAVLVVLLLALNWVYFSKRMIPAKYLVPGMVFLLIYQVFVMGYTGYVSFTNYGNGHNSTKEDALHSILIAAEERAPGAKTMPAAVVEDASGYGLAIADCETDAVQVGTEHTPMHDVQGKCAAGMITEVAGYKVLTIADILKPDVQTEVAKLRVQVSQDVNDGSYKTDDGTSAYEVKYNKTYDAAADTLTDVETGVVYTANDKIGAYVDADGNAIDPGWRVFVGFDNYRNMFTRGDLAGPFLKALVWSFVFAAVSVLSTFALGLILGLVFSDKRIKGRKIYQSLMILPYAFPAFLATLVWKGMLNTEFGFVNNVLLAGSKVPWLDNGLLAKVSILGVNLWLGFPYMFLVCLGALQSLPSDVEEAAKIDGASGLRTVWSIKLPLVLQSTVPLLIASFAFNFNNFSLIYMLTKGGPNYPGMDVGETDILISMVYKIAIESGSADYGLASAMSIIIFIVVGVIAWLGFRQTKTLEEL